MTEKPNSRARLKKKAMTIYLDRPQAEALQRLSERTRVAQQVYLREGLGLVLARYKRR